MVFADFDDFEDQYNRVRQVACGRLACSVMIIVALEVDALATANMLCQLLRGDNIAYSVRPVSNLDQILKTFQDHMTTDIRTIFMINCGAIHDIPRLFDLERGGDVRCFVLDHHRPIHLKNYYSKYNVVVFGSEMDAEDIPSDGSELSFNESDDTSVRSNDSESAHSEDNSEAASQENDEANEVDEEEEEVEEREEEEEEGEEEDGEEGEEELFAAPAKEEDEEEDEEEEEEEEQEAEGEDEQEEEEGSRSGESAASVPPGQSRREAGAEGSPESRRQSAHRQPRHAATADLLAASLAHADSAQAFDYGHDEAEGGEDEDADSLQPILGKRRGLSSELQVRRAKRQRILRYYRRPPSHAPPTAIVVMPFVKARLSGNGVEPVDVMWQAILGLTDHFLRGTIGEKYYNACCHLLKVELGEHLRSPGQLSLPLGAAASESGAQASVQVSASCAGRIAESVDFRFFLYRHWSLYESMCHSACIASRFPVWKSEGLRRLQGLLAEVGVSRQQCSQAYAFMDPHSRRRFEHELRDHAALRMKYDVRLEAVTFPSFVRHVDYKHPVAAADTVLAAAALWEGPDAQTASPDRDDSFFQAGRLLGAQTSRQYAVAVHRAIDIQRAVVRQAAALLDGHDGLHRYHRLYYATIRTSRGGGLAATAHDGVFSKPSVLARLGQFIMHVKRELPRKNGGWRGTNLLPLILLSEVDDGVMVMGISPLLQLPESSDPRDVEHLGRLLPLTNFLQFFQLAAKDLHISIKFDSFDSNCVKVAKDDAQDFLGALDNAMRKATPNFASKGGST